MTDKELHKLKRSELLELLIFMREENDKLRTENQELKESFDKAIDNRKLLEKILDTVSHDTYYNKENADENQ